MPEQVARRGQAEPGEALRLTAADAGQAADLVEHAEGLDEHTRHKAGFYVKQVSNAISPSNFILTNPELFRETVASNGENLVRGMKMLAEDIAAGKGDLKLRQADYSPFEIGRNIATTPGKVVGRIVLVP